MIRHRIYELEYYAFLKEKYVSLLYNPNWENAKRSFTGWWNGTNATRPLLQVTAPLDKPIEDIPAPPPPVSPDDQWLNAKLRMDTFEYNASRTFYGGDAVPYFDPQLGPGTMALYVGSPPTFKPDTVWYGKIHDDIRKAPLPEFDECNKYWQWSLKTAKEAVERFKGKALVSFPDLIEGADILASLVGTQELLYYMVDHPTHVHRLLERLTDLYFEYYDRLYEIIEDDRGGSCFSAFWVWGPGRTAKVQCDYCAMISPQMFREFVQPYLREQCRRLDHSVYHLDGPDCIVHLDALLEIEELKAIQWTPGVNQPSAGDKAWWPLFYRIIEGEKSVMALGVAPAGVEPLIAEFGPARLDIVTWCATEEEARALLDRFK